ncbi:MAG: hypothetical protein OEW62_01990 [Candidatus Bathyarchaeota archaeon]|nr:hypothetical protein [Candidatus Bathyarchaeota archaeon]MDH5595128.1 hypothetical protein [Candidatus Bathyarchaeota archaeon]
MRESSKVIGYILLVFGTLSLILSIFYEHVILAFIGLGLTFWGALLLFIRPGKYVKEKLLNTTTLPTLADINQILAELEYQGKPTYLPPKYFTNPETCQIYIPKDKNTTLPTPQETKKHENKIFLKNPEAALIIPPGLSLSKLFEKTTGKSFTKTDIEHLQQNLPKIFIEDLEIAENIEIQTKPSKTAKKLTDAVALIHLQTGTIHAKITNSVYTDTCKETETLPHIHAAIGCPICSAIAIAITKATRKPVTIEKEQTNGRNIDTEYRIILEE